MIINHWQLSLVLGLILSSVTEGQRISQIKCEEYIQSAKSTPEAVFCPLISSSYLDSGKRFLPIEGEDASEGEFPHHVLLGWETEKPGEYQFHCGGTLISDRYVMTAAHCMVRLKEVKPQPVVVRFGALNLKHPSSSQFDVEIEHRIRHPKHLFTQAYHDIALIRLKKAVKFTDRVRPACLWSDVNTNDSPVVATGFGKTEANNAEGSDKLLKVHLDVFDWSECCKQFRGTRNFRRGMKIQQLCLGSRKDRQDTCHGDSGGPIQVLLNRDECIYHVIGITSVGLVCGVTNTPAVYTKVAGYIDWIERVVWKA